jgi:hypothetical protein
MAAFADAAFRQSCAGAWNGMKREVVIGMWRIMNPRKAGRGKLG